jgi:hypothetical protein
VLLEHLVMQHQAQGRLQVVALLRRYAWEDHPLPALHQHDQHLRSHHCWLLVLMLPWVTMAAPLLLMAMWLLHCRHHVMLAGWCLWVAGAGLDLLPPCPAVELRGWIAPLTAAKVGMGLMWTQVQTRYLLLCMHLLALVVWSPVPPLQATLLQVEPVPLPVQKLQASQVVLHLQQWLLRACLLLLVAHLALLQVVVMVLQMSQLPELSQQVLQGGLRCPWWHQELLVLLRMLLLHLPLPLVLLLPLLVLLPFQVAVVLSHLPQIL